MAKKRDHKIMITDEAIEKVPFVKYKKIPESAVECSGDCTNCLQCWNIASGESVVFNKH